MLQYKYRLRKNSHFSYTYKKGTSVTGRLMVLVYAFRRGTGLSIGFSVSNKTGKATVRNKLKRRMRECARQLLKDGLFKNGFNYVFVARLTAALASFDQIQDEMLRLITKTAKK